MKFASEFSSFLIDEVNLNKTRIANLGAKSKAIEEFVYDNWAIPIRGFSHQGSWAHDESDEVESLVKWRRVRRR